jgi:hypothetical protein
LFSSEKIFITSSQVFVSNAQVGSSAKIKAGSITIALAIATLCFCPHDNSSGLLVNLSSSHTFARAFIALCFACFLFTQA